MLTHMATDGLDLNDDGWATPKGGYRVPYDPRKAFGLLESGDDVSMGEGRIVNRYDTVILFRPVGPYAIKIARDWNVPVSGADQKIYPTSIATLSA